MTTTTAPAPGLPDGWSIITLTETTTIDITTITALTRATAIHTCPGCGRSDVPRDPQIPQLQLLGGTVQVWEQQHACGALLSTAVPWVLIANPADDDEIQRAADRVRLRLAELGWLEDDVTHQPCTGCGTQVEVTWVDGSPQETDAQGRIVCDDCA